MSNERELRDTVQNTQTRTNLKNSFSKLSNGNRTRDLLITHILFITPILLTTGPLKVVKRITETCFRAHTALTYLRCDWLGIFRASTFHRKPHLCSSLRSAFSKYGDSKLSPNVVLYKLLHLVTNLKRHIVSMYCTKNM